MPKNNKRDSIIAGAHAQFRLYGYRKTSMEDIAGELCISRSSLYSYFENKDEIFRSVSVLLHEQALANAEECLRGSWRQENAFSKVERALLARHLPFHEEQFHSAHAGELQDEYSRLCGDVVTRSNMKFQQYLTEGLDAAVKANILRLQSAYVSTADVAELLNLATAGLKRGAVRPGLFEARVARFLSAFIRGLSQA
jgi:AcrR family transcriptional regulator